jgi:hypothetical protein
MPPQTFKPTFNMDLVNQRVEPKIDGFTLVSSVIFLNLDPKVTVSSCPPAARKQSMRQKSSSHLFCFTFSALKPEPKSDVGKKRVLEKVPVCEPIILETVTVYDVKYDCKFLVQFSAPASCCRDGSPVYTRASAYTCSNCP